MKDQYGREIDYLRISVTDKCNLHCSYCMPEEPPMELHTDRTENKRTESRNSNTGCYREILTLEELHRLAQLFARTGIRKVKLTGGEPLLREDLTDIIAMLKKECGMESVTLTTNGVLLVGKTGRLIEAGLDGVNISLDTLDKEKYRKITGRDCLDTVLDAVCSCAATGQFKVKVNCVLMEQEAEELLALAELAATEKIAVRFIEQMPIGHAAVQQKWTEERVKELFVAEGLSLFPEKQTWGNGPAHYYKIEGDCGTIGFISAMSHKFCRTCNRLRLTAGGFLKPCLQYGTGTDLGELLRNGASDEMLLSAIRQCIYEKPQCHHFNKRDGIETESMAEIGG